jgi:hypothetical protein
MASTAVGVSPKALVLRKETQKIDQTGGIIDGDRRHSWSHYSIEELTHFRTMSQLFAPAFGPPCLSSTGGRQLH